jgi:hypothetical protein
MGMEPEAISDFERILGGLRAETFGNSRYRITWGGRQEGLDHARDGI